MLQDTPAPEQARGGAGGHATGRPPEPARQPRPPPPHPAHTWARPHLIPAPPRPGPGPGAAAGALQPRRAPGEGGEERGRPAGSRRRGEERDDGKGSGERGLGAAGR